MHRLGKGEKNEEVPSRWQKLLEHDIVNKYSSVVSDMILKWHLWSLNVSQTNGKSRQ